MAVSRTLRNPPAKHKHMDKNLVSSALDAVNKQNIEIAEGRAAEIIAKISRLNCSMKQSTEGIGDLQNALAALAKPCITDKCILGHALPPEGARNENEKTIAAVLAKLIKGKQGDVEERSNRISEAILQAKAAIEGAELEKAKLVEQLLEIKPEVVTADEITDKAS
jgi:hypothetical protein